MSVNITNEYFKNCKKEITDYLNLIMGSKSNKNIANLLIEGYLEARYYNYAESNTIKNMITNYLKDTAKNLNENKDLINIYLDIFNQMFYFDSFQDDLTIKNKVNTINNYRVQKLGINEKGFVENFIKIIKYNNNQRNKYLKNISSKDFYLNVSKTNIKDVFDVQIKHNITFNKLYSEFAINNAFNTGLVNENKMSVIYYLYVKILLENIINGDFTKNYLIDFDSELFLKKKKLTGNLIILDSDPIRELTSFKIKYTDFLNNKNEFYDMKKEGYNFAVIIDDSYIDDITNFTTLQIFKYIIMEEEYDYPNINNMDNVIKL